ncbi:hypothetical protein I316_06855 [Kwoniella heveanensis BCC8398]|uniref:Uncharacterized protein n=1 Tax=Kwoniella heveanensis BCC8398 TaxID=1296120 RepID=A0A1B9GKH5_9TREE|nr:hypothetical protein I316_06855 [Kwoniella heveanensis BCC8398]
MSNAACGKRTRTDGPWAVERMIDVLRARHPPSPSSTEPPDDPTGTSTATAPQSHSINRFLQNQRDSSDEEQLNLESLSELVQQEVDSRANWVSRFVPDASVQLACQPVRRSIVIGPETLTDYADIARRTTEFDSQTQPTASAVFHSDCESKRDCRKFKKWLKTTQNSQAELCSDLGKTWMTGTNLIAGLSTVPGHKSQRSMNGYQAQYESMTPWAWMPQTALFLWKPSQSDIPWVPTGRSELLPLTPSEESIKLIVARSKLPKTDDEADII